VSGEILGLRSDAMAEPGNPIAAIIFNQQTPESLQSYSE
jgi:hypothetical protein